MIQSNNHRFFQLLSPLKKSHRLFLRQRLVNAKTEEKTMVHANTWTKFFMVEPVEMYSRSLHYGKDKARHSFVKNCEKCPKKHHKGVAEESVTCSFKWRNAAYHVVLCSW
jgi:hypothetical protein